MRFFIFFLFVFVLFKVRAQDQPFQPDNLESLKNQIEFLHESYLDRITGSNAREIKKYYKDFDESFIKQIEDGNFWFDKEMEEHLEKILQKVYAANPDFNRADHLWLIDKSLIPNAACYGNGIFTINAGLFLHNHSNDQIAFVICHELAHLKEQHSLKRITSIVHTLESKETKKKIKAAKRKRYGSTRAGLALIDDLSTEILDHSKDAENEADMIGLSLFQKTNFDKNAPALSLSYLGDFDKRMESYTIRLDTIFTTSAYKFKKYWIEKSTSLFEKDADLNDFSMKSDTLKTHPDIENRVKNIQNITESSRSTSIQRNSYTAQNIHFKILEMSIASGELDLSLFSILKSFENKNLDSGQYHLLMNQLLLQLGELKKVHELGKKVSASDNDSDYTALNDIRNLLYNISYKNVAKLQVAYHKEHL